jgi:predicted nucleic acid-binding protein
MSERDRVLVDTSAWIDFLAGDARIVRALEPHMDDRRVVICGQVRQEVLQGARDEKAFARLQRDMSLWMYEAEQPTDYDAAARVYARLRWKGTTIPPSDCLIAALAKRCGLAIYATDPHFRQIPDVVLVEL